ncbi:MAG: 7-cyano-7-deazaguanine synthase QueC, partial [Methanosarcinaceae archaeon]|nr:7-cyano-7-deazaguanine synthase QueC [Methanosarcinaceae archaeon]
MNAISLLSSGLDSTVAHTIISESVNIELSLTFDYGQKSVKKEIEYAKKLSDYFNVEHKVVDIKWLVELTNTALVNSKKKIPKLTFEDISDDADSCITKESAKSVWVPNRNGVMLNIAASFAESLGCKYIIVGFNKEEAQTFPDNSIEYMRALDSSLAYSTQNHVKVIAPLIEFNKTEIVKKAIRLKAPLHLSWSCYHGEESPCGECESCVRRMRAFKDVGAKDPL